MALMVCETVGWDTPSLSPITACTMFWRYITAACSDSDSPMRGGYPSTHSSRRRMSRSANSAADSSVVYFMTIVRSFRSHEGVFSTMIPHGSGPSSYHLPEMTQDTPRITFLMRIFSRPT